WTGADGWMPARGGHDRGPPPTSIAWEQARERRAKPTRAHSGLSTAGVQARGGPGATARPQRPKAHAHCAGGRIDRLAGGRVAVASALERCSISRAGIRGECVAARTQRATAVSTRKCYTGWVVMLGRVGGGRRSKLPSIAMLLIWCGCYGGLGNSDSAGAQGESGSEGSEGRSESDETKGVAEDSEDGPSTTESARETGTGTTGTSTSTTGLTSFTSSTTAASTTGLLM